MSVYQAAVKRPITTILIFLGIAIMGLFSLSKLSIDLFPEIETNSIMVMTTYSGASAEDIETNVTRPLENILNGVSDLKHLTSKSRENISLITLEFEYGIDIDVATNDVRDKLDQVTTLPDGATTPILFKFGTEDIPILILSVTADESMSGLYKILDDNVATPLARVSGVGTVSISGTRINWRLTAFRLKHSDRSLRRKTAMCRPVPSISVRTYTLCVCRKSLPMSTKC